MTGKPADVDAYIAGLPPELRETARAVRATLRQALPGATETISYAIPAYRIGKKTVIYFAVWKRHVGVYPIREGSAAFEAKVGPYRATKATVRFPLNEPVPHGLIEEIAQAQIIRAGIGTLSLPEN